jgi:hypothetical protein
MKWGNDNIHVNREPHFCQHTPSVNMVVSSNALVAGLALRVSIEVVQQDVAIAYVCWLSRSIPGFCLALNGLVEQFEPCVAPLCLPLPIIRRTNGVFCLENAT